MLLNQRILHHSLTYLLITSLCLSAAIADTTESVSTETPSQHLQSNSDDIFGLWLESKKQNVAVRIEPCDGQLCGYIYWLRKPLTRKGNPKRDKHNPDESLRQEKLCGLKLLSGFSQDEDKNWSGGEIYSPEDGYKFSSTIKRTDENSLRIRGYIGIPLLGKTVNWHRPEKQLPPCQ